MTLLATLSSSGRVDHVEEFITPGLAHQAAMRYTASGVVCRIVPDEMKEDVLYLMGQVREERNNGFVEERGVVPNGHPKKAGARSFGRMIYPPFGGMLEDQDGLVTENAASRPHDKVMQQEPADPLTFSSTKAKTPPEKMDDDLIILRHG